MDGNLPLPEKDNIFPPLEVRKIIGSNVPWKGDVLVPRERTVTVLMIVQKSLGENTWNIVY